MNRSTVLLAVACCLALAGPASASSSDPALAALSVPVAAPHRLAIRHRTWNGDTHAQPHGRAVLESADRQAVWEVAGVTRAAASADGSTVAFLTRDHQILVSSLPETPRLVPGGPYLSPALSSDGNFLLAQRLGEGGHILEMTFNTRGIALVDLATGEDRLLVEGNDLYSPSFASDDLVFFGSGGKDRTASLYLLDLANMSVARVTNRAEGARETFPSENPRLRDGMVVYRADEELFRVPAPAPEDFVPLGRFDAPVYVESEVAGFSPDFGSVRTRRPNTQSNTPPVFWYYDLDKRSGQVKDWNCQKQTYDNHLGTDINQSLGYNVVAPASGEVILRNDGCADVDSKGCGQGFGNWVAIKHSDRTVSLEAHGKKWTVVPLGTYACGATLMKSASSGNSSKPHVHHESWIDPSAQGNKDKKYDPFRGSCDPNDPTKWSSQGPYLGLPGTSCTN